MPENTGGDRAPGGPGSGHAREPFRVGKATETLDLLCGSGQSQITHRPDVGTAKGHKEIDVGRPWTHAGKLQQDCTDCLIAQLGNGGEVEGAGKERSGERVTVGCLLPSETGFAEPAFGGGRYMTRGNSTGDALEPGIGGLGRREGDLLFENDADQRGEARASGPQRWWSISLDDSSKITIACREFAHASKESGLGELSRRVPRCQSQHDLLWRKLTPSWFSRD